MGTESMPTNKVQAGIAAGAMAVLVAWSAKQFAHIDVPAEIGVALSTLFTFIVQYMVRDAAPKEQS